MHSLYCIKMVWISNKIRLRTHSADSLLSNSCEMFTLSGIIDGTHSKLCRNVTICARYPFLFKLFFLPSPSSSYILISPHSVASSKLDILVGLLRNSEHVRAFLRFCYECERLGKRKRRKKQKEKNMRCLCSVLRGIELLAGEFNSL